MIADLTPEIKKMFSCLARQLFAVARVDLRLLRYKRQKVSGNWQDLFLAPVERSQFAGFQLAKRQNEWLGGRISVKAAVASLREEENVAGPQIIVSVAKSGRPFLADSFTVADREISISLSHSKNIAVGLAAPCLCGIDIQEIRPVVSRVREHFSTAAECDLLAQSPVTSFLTPDFRLSLLWAAKEALMKTFDLSPLLFFSEINLRSVESAANSGVSFLFSCERDGELLPMSCRVFAFIIENYAFACCLHGVE